MSSMQRFGWRPVISPVSFGRPSRASRPTRRWSRATGRPWSIPVRARPTSPPRAVLVVDDDNFGREALGQILEADGYEVHRAATGDEGLEQLCLLPCPGLIVLDLMSPLEGWLFLHRLQGRGRLAEVPVIALSVADWAEARQPEPGIVAQFEKPTPVPTLLEAIHQHLPPI